MRNPYGDTLFRLTRLSLFSLAFFLPLMTSAAVISGIIALAAWILSGNCIKMPHVILRERWGLALSLMLLLPLIGLFWSSDLKTGGDFAEKSYYWLFAFIVATTFRSDDEVNFFLKVFLAGLTCNVTLSILQFFHLFPYFGERPTGLMLHVPHSLHVVFGMLLLSYFFKSSVRILQPVLIGILLLFAISLAISEGRIGYLAFTILSPIIVIQLVGKRSWMLPIAVIIAGSFLLLFPPVRARTTLAVHQVRDYIALGETGNSSVGARIYMWKKAYEIFLAHPLIGVGTGSYKNEQMKYKSDKSYQEAAHPHNTFLYYAASYGLLGISVLLFFFASYFQEGWRERGRISGYAILCYGAVMMIGSLTDTQILTYSTGLLLALLSGFHRSAIDEYKR
ncbi:MAG: O-antigen ligase family protein [Deltaproteobacteria bacterium]|nr:O-antigen ligase family protein [Deltaproteobacteria bacterium]